MHRLHRAAFLVSVVLAGQASGLSAADDATPRPVASNAPGEVVHLKAAADICLSSEITKDKDERQTSMGLSPRLKLKSVQEMAAIRFDAAPAAGRQVASARLRRRRMGDKDMLRYLRASTVNQDWEEGTTKDNYGSPSGACYLFADFQAKRSWTFPGSCFADAAMTSGNSLACWAECRKLADGWISVDIAPELVTAMAVGDSDGLAVCDGGNLAYFNNLIHSVQAGEKHAPYLEVELGAKLDQVPAEPKVKAAPATASAWTWWATSASKPSATPSSSSNT
jgi:hypothetical protein